LGYRAAKFIRRRRIEVAASALLLVSLIGGIVATSRQARLADSERQKAEQVNAFLTTMLSAVDPGYQGRDVTVAQVLKQAAKDIDSQKLDPDIEAEIRHTIGQTYYGLGLYDEAEPQSRRAFDLRRTLYGMRDGRTANSLSYIVALFEARGEYAKAESTARIGLEIQRNLPTINTAELATFLDNLARMIEHQGRLDEAMKYKREALDLRRSSNDSASRAGLTYSLNNFAVSLTYRGEYAAAESLHREALRNEQAKGGETPNYGETLRGLAGVLDDMGRSHEADSLARESVRILKKTLGAAHPNYLRALSSFARMRLTAGDAHTAMTAAREIVGQIGGPLPEGDQTASSATQILGVALDSLGDLAGADSALRRSLALRKKYLPPEHWAIASSESVLGWHLVLQKKYAEAERMLLNAYERIAAARGPDSLPAHDTAHRLAMLYERLGRKADAAKWKGRAGGA
jgi:tetratricopeptide (TPR) repeat protein